MKSHIRCSSGGVSARHSDFMLATLTVRPTGSSTIAMVGPDAHSRSPDQRAPCCRASSRFAAHTSQGRFSRCVAIQTERTGAFSGIAHHSEVPTNALHPVAPQAASRLNKGRFSRWARFKRAHRRFSAVMSRFKRAHRRFQPLGAIQKKKGEPEGSPQVGE